MSAPALPDIIADLRMQINVLPLTSIAHADFLAQYDRQRVAAQRLGRYLTQTYGARISDRPDYARIRMHGITSTSTGGLIAAYQNWIDTAEQNEAKRVAVGEGA